MNFIAARLPSVTVARATRPREPPLTLEDFRYRVSADSHRQAAEALVRQGDVLLDGPDPFELLVAEDAASNRYASGLPIILHGFRITFVPKHQEQLACSTTP